MQSHVNHDSLFGARKHLPIEIHAVIFQVSGHENAGLSIVAVRKGYAGIGGNAGGRRDAWYDLKHPEIRSLMQHIAERGHVVGFHPSREAAKDEVRFNAELSALRQVSPVPVVSGRHHYLCFDAPFTWQMWEKNGLEMDSTLGYPDVPGFRCGICVDYPVFDFLQKRTLSLREQPLMAMEVTFARYLQLDPENTLSNLLELRAQVQRFDGQFTLLWHNSSLNTWFWDPYRPVFEKMLL